METPVAGPLKDGEISFTTSKMGPILHNTLSFQALPRVYAALRYTGIGDKQIMYYQNSGYTYWDRSFDLRFDLVEENNFLPSISAGFQDIVGGGTFGAEYIVASKKFKSIKLSTGLGWGRLSSNKILNNNSTRKESPNSYGGGLKYKHLFSGPIGVFGGLEAKATKNINIKIEYSSEDRTRYSHFIKNINDNKINYGLDYNLNDHVKLSLYNAAGQELGMQMNISASPSSTFSGDYLEQVPKPFYSSPLEQNSQTIPNLIKDLEEEKIEVIAHRQEKNEFTIVIENTHFSSNTQAIGRTLRLMSVYVDLKYNVFNVILSSYGVPVSKLSIKRNDIVSIVDAPNAELFTGMITKLSDAPRVIENANIYQDRSKFSWSVLPYYKFHFFDPDKPLYYDFGPRIKFGYYPKSGITFQGSLVKSLYTTFDEIKRGTKGNLPKVRTNLKNYANITDARIEDLTLSSYFKLSKNTYGRSTVGYLEQMYAGISSEFLYKPMKENFAFGAELNYVKGREFRQLMGFRTVNGLSKLNGHLSGYFDTNFYDYIAQLDYGKYLAGDKGYTLTLTRDFRNGWKVGGFFTITNASHADFGEGSFDKGIFLSFPLNPLMPYETRSTLNEKIRPIQGDGGSRVEVSGRLYSLIHDTSQNNIQKTWPKIWR